MKKLLKKETTLDTLARLINDRFDGVEERMSSMESCMATKDELRALEMATKDELRALEMATKDELRGVEERLSLKIGHYERGLERREDEEIEMLKDHEKRINKLEDRMYAGK